MTSLYIRCLRPVTQESPFVTILWYLSTDIICDWSIKHKWKPLLLGNLLTRSALLHLFSMMQGTVVTNVPPTTLRPNIQTITGEVSLHEQGTFSFFLYMHWLVFTHEKVHWPLRGARYMNIRVKYDLWWRDWSCINLVLMGYSIMILVKFRTSPNQKHWIWSCDESGVCNLRLRLLEDEVIVGSSLMFKKMDPWNIIR